MQKENIPALIELLTQFGRQYYNAMNDEETAELERTLERIKKINAQQ